MNALATVSSARTAVTSSDFFALSYLALCYVSYLNEADRDKALNSITAAVPGLPPYSKCPGTWSLLWGPAATIDNSNLMYAAAYNDQVSGEPIYAAVVIRGTDVTKANFTPSGEVNDILPLIQQLLQDLDTGVQRAWPYANSNNPGGSALVALGTLRGLQKKLLTLTDDASGETITDFLQSYVAQNAGVPIVVTGHSLGGCQTTVMALYLQSVLPAGTLIVPNSIAAPTAGNAAFAAMYEASFPYCPRWFNTLDLVPYAFADLEGLVTLWDSCGTPVPAAQTIVNFIEKAIPSSVTYTQAGSPRMLIGICMPQPPPSWLSATAPPAFNQLAYQHYPLSGYLPMLKDWPGVEPFPYSAFFTNPSSSG